MLLQLLDNKNNELEEMRSEHHIKVTRLEAINQRLERKLAQLKREGDLLQEMRDKEAAESRQSTQLLKRQLQTEHDKKVQTL